MKEMMTYGEVCSKMFFGCACKRHWVESEIPTWLEKCGSYENFQRMTHDACASDSWKLAAKIMAKDFWDVVEEEPEHKFFKREKWLNHNPKFEERYQGLIPQKDSHVGVFSSDIRYNDIHGFYDISICGEKFKRYVKKLLDYCNEEGYTVKVMDTWDIRRVGCSPSGETVKGKRIWIYAK